MQQPAADRHHIRRQHEEMLSEMRRNTRTERQLIEQSRARIVCSRDLLNRTDQIVRPPGQSAAGQSSRIDPPIASPSDSRRILR